MAGSVLYQVHLWGGQRTIEPWCLGSGFNPSGNSTHVREVRTRRSTTIIASFCMRVGYTLAVWFACTPPTRRPGLLCVTDAVIVNVLKRYPFEAHKGVHAGSAVSLRVVPIVGESIFVAMKCF